MEPTGEIKRARVELIDGSSKLWIEFEDGRSIRVPVSDQVAVVLNAGGWMMREHIAQVFEFDLKSTNLVSRRVRMIGLGTPERA